MDTTENEENWEEIELVRIQQEFEEQEKTAQKEMNRDEKIQTIQNKNIQLNSEKKTSEEKWTVWRRDCTANNRQETDVGNENIAIHPVDNILIMMKSSLSQPKVNTISLQEKYNSPFQKVTEKRENNNVE